MASGCSTHLLGILSPSSQPSNSAEGKVPPSPLLPSLLYPHTSTALTQIQTDIPGEAAGGQGAGGEQEEGVQGLPWGLTASAQKEGSSVP